MTGMFVEYFRMSCWKKARSMPFFYTRGDVVRVLCLRYGTYQWWANFKSQSYIQISNLLFSNPKSEPQLPISKLKIPIKFQIQVFPQVHKHELRSVQQRRELAICQCQCYLIACLKCVWLSLSHQFQSQQENQLTQQARQLNSKKDWWVTTTNDSAVKSHGTNPVTRNTKLNRIPIVCCRIESLNCGIASKKCSNPDRNLHITGTYCYSLRF